MRKNISVEIAILLHCNKKQEWNKNIIQFGVRRLSIAPSV